MKNWLIIGAAFLILQASMAYGMERDVVKNAAVSILEEVANNPQIKKEAWDWGEGILFWGVANLARKEASIKARTMPLLRDYFTNAVSSVEDPIHVTPAIAALLSRELFAEDARALKAISAHIETSMSYVERANRNSIGSIDHYGNSWINTWNFVHRHTIWLDSAIAWQVAATKYSMDRSNAELAEFVFAQPEIFARLLKNQEYGLYYHAAKVKSKRTLPRRPHFWLRGNAWMGVTLVEMLESLQDTTLIAIRNKHEKAIRQQFQSLVDALIQQQRDSGLWTTLIRDSKSDEEISGSALLVYMIKKGIRIGVLDRKYESFADKGLEGILKKLTPDSLGTSVTQISAGTFPVPIFSKTYYRHVPLTVNKNYGVGAVLMAMSEYL